MTTEQPTTDPRAEYIAGLRMLADVLEANPHLRQPYEGNQSAMMVMPHHDERKELADWARVLPGRKEKRDRDNYFDLIGAFRGLKIQVICHRDEVCDRVVTGVEMVTKKVKDPEALAAVPEIEVEEEIEIVEWKCGAILGDRDGELAEVAA